MLSDRNDIGLTEIRIPADNLLVTINNGDKWTRMKTTENGTRIHIVATTLTIKKLYLIKTKFIQFRKMMLFYGVSSFL